MGETAHDQISITPSSGSDSTSTLVDEPVRENLLLETYDEDFFAELPGIPTPRCSQNNNGIYLSSFRDTNSTIYANMAEIPLVPCAAAPAAIPTKQHDLSLWSAFLHPQWKQKCAPVNEPVRFAPPPSIKSSPSYCSAKSSLNKSMPVKSSLSSSPSIKSRRARMQQPSVKFAEKPTIHYDNSNDTQDTISPVSVTPLSRLGHLIGLRRSKKEQAAPERPQISGPFPMHRAAAMKCLQSGVHPARSQASIRTTGSASSSSGFRVFWDRLIRPDG